MTVREWCSRTLRTLARLLSNCIRQPERAACMGSCMPDGYAAKFDAFIFGGILGNVIENDDGSGAEKANYQMPAAPTCFGIAASLHLIVEFQNM
eukprot:2247851-Amphidinium_carterae.2